MMKLYRRRVLACILGGASMLLSGASAVHAQQSADDWEKVVQAAKKEGQVVVYTANAGQTSHKLVAAAFEKKYGIPVTFLEARASEIRERVRTEQAAGRFIGDLSHNGSTTSTLQEKEGVFQPFGWLPNLSALREPFRATKTRVPVFASTYSILINTRLVKPGEEPKSWQDLADPKWKGKILSDDMRALGGGAVAFFVLHDVLHKDYLDKLAANKPVFSRDLRASERRVARGDYAVWIPMGTTAYPDLKGLPVKLIAPQEGYPYIAYETAVLKNAPHPNAARLLMNFFLSDEAQLIHAGEGLRVVTGVAVPPTTAEVDAVRSGKLMGTTDAMRQDEMLKLAKEVFK